MYDYHVHSNFSADCNVDMEEMINHAIEIGIKEISFTDHIDYDYQDSSITFEFDIDPYIERIEYLREKYKGKIKILRGIEIGIQPHIIQKCDSLIEGKTFDFVISSLHTADKKDIHVGTFFMDKTPHECYEKYFNELLICAKNFKNFNVIGHIDLLRRYKNHMKVPDIYHFFDILKEIFKVIIYNGKGIEINTSGFRYGLDDTIPSRNILNLYKSMGGEIITIGSDAHHPNYLGYKFDYAYHLLKEEGFKYITTFEKMKPTFIKF